MQHYFDVNIAIKYGVNSAILLQNLGHWIKRNEANQKNYFDGNYWTYNSRRAYHELFPYMSERQINTAFQKLIDAGLIITGNYNKMGCDRTLWYALTQKGKCILHFDIMQCAEMSNAMEQNVSAIPNINTNKKTANINTNKKERKKATNYDEILSSVNADIRELYIEYIKMRKLIKSPMTDRALTMLINKVNELEPNNIGRQKQLLENAILNNWKSVYPLKNDNVNQNQGTGNVFLDMLNEMQEGGYN